MKAIVTLGVGGYEQLQYQEVPIPDLNTGEVLIKVLAAGMNNTEINTRLGWYSAAVTEATNSVESVDSVHSERRQDGGWNAQTPFPFIQGTDCCGEVVKVASSAHAALLNQRVLVRPCIRLSGFERLATRWLGSDFDGAFAQYVKVPASEVFPIHSDWSDAALGSIPCAYGTSENMLERAKLGSPDRVLVTGASGGVGSATVQLAKRRGAQVIAVAGETKLEQVSALGADRVLSRSDDLRQCLGEESVDVVVDNVGGPDFSVMLKLLKRGGRLVSSGAIAGPIVPLDMRDMYLKDLRLIGTTAWDECVFPNLIGYIERQEIQPAVARIFPLSQIVSAQQLFLEKRHVGKFVLIPEHDAK